jgi:thiamine biosynthesis protein ThiS
MKVQINGEMRDFEAPMSVLQLLTVMNLPSHKIAVELNLEIVPKSAYHSQMVAAGDRIEIVHFIGGG